MSVKKREMQKKYAEMRRRRKEMRQEQKQDQYSLKRMSAYTNGHADFTPFSAITGKEKIGKPILTDPSHKVNGSFNG